MARIEFLKELWDFMRVRKRYWLAPIILIFMLFGLLLIFTETSVVAPFIYTLF
ncbi:MAG: hypothetical protein HY922_13485 [Elusimicrobia bacterium]|nr:hypothetical protein [Elusimicrobiota bacterium]